ncbi:MAG: terminase large subunit domain-containing protein, partial [Promethearchaeota archaeon]
MDKKTEKCKICNKLFSPTEKYKTVCSLKCKNDAIRQLWEMGNLEWKLKGNQKKIHKRINNSTDKVHTVLSSRRLGKSYTLCLTAIETCIKIPKAVVKYACPTKSQVEEIITDIIPNFILNDCPEHLKPVWHEQKKHYLFPNGSKIQIAGTDKDKGNKLRGGRAHLCIVDEAQDHNYLSYVINFVLLPTTLTTHGSVVLCGTPNPLQPQHEFHTDYISTHEGEGKLIKFTIYDSPLYDERGEDLIKELEQQYRHRGGLKSAEFLSEYMCEIAIDKEAMVIPEFTKEIEEIIVKEVERPPFYDAYVGLDIGFS